jgi:lysophospholipid acyltransferase (LPLAT)-like uncharacterized protein
VSRSAPFVPHRPTLAQRLLARLLHGLVHLLTATMRFRWERDPGFLRVEGRPYIFCTWHNRLLLAPLMYARYARRIGAPPRLAAMVSASRDGAMMARVLELFGIEPVRGSSSRRGAEALKESAELSKGGHDLAFACDGPRGPVYVAKPGIVVLAQMTGRPVVPVSYVLSRKIALRSWDRFEIPLPFSTCVFRVGDPVEVPRHYRDEDRERVRQGLEAEMRHLTSG